MRVFEPQRRYALRQRLGRRDGIGAGRLIVAVLLVLSACAPVPPVRTPAPEPELKPPAASVAPRPASEEPRPTIAERAARRDARLQESAPAPSPSTGPDYASGYPKLSPAPKPRADGSLQSFVVLDTGPYLANHNVHNLVWKNDSGRRLAIYKAYAWTGFDRGGIADVHIEARRASDNSYIAILQWDHYADPTIPQHGQQFDYPMPMMLDPGDTIEITHFANGFAAGWHAHHLLILWVK